jgi:hypothetical protein
MSKKPVPEDAFSFLCRWARRPYNRSTPFSPEEVIRWASLSGVCFQDQRAWGAVFRRAAREGVIRPAGIFGRATSNGSKRPGWVGQ